MNRVNYIDGETYSYPPPRRIARIVRVLGGLLGNEESLWNYSDEKLEMFWQAALSAPNVSWFVVEIGSDGKPFPVTEMPLFFENRYVARALTCYISLVGYGTADGYPEECEATLMKWTRNRRRRRPTA